MKKPRPNRAIGRKRRAAGWTLLALGVIVAGVWVWSGEHDLGWDGAKHRAALFGGKLGVGRLRNSQMQWGDSGWSVVDHQAYWSYRLPSGPDTFLGLMNYWKADEDGGGTEESAMVVLWPIPLALWAAGVPVLGSGILTRRRAITGKCVSCGYDLAGIRAGAPCPECGKAKAG